MQRLLQVVLALFAIALTLEGLLDLALPIERAQGLGLGDRASQAQLAMEILGATWFAAGICTLAILRDPAAHPSWLRFLVVLPLSLVVALGIAVVRGHARFADVAIDLVVDVVFATLIAVLARSVRRSRSASGIAPRAAA
jgi:hypothetical protein